VINAKNLLIIAVLVVLNAVAFLWGQYHTLMPVIYIVGFVGITIISFWFGNQLETKDILVLAMASTVIAFFDEYAHCSAGTLSYFDGGVPSLLTVFGWSIFMISILAIAKVLTKNVSVEISGNKMLRTLPVIVTLILITAIVVVQDYLSIFNLSLGIVYFFLFATSLYYTYAHPLKWNIILMAISLILGVSMEYIGRLEGLWAFRFQDPISYLILFSWPLRIWAVTTLCCAFDVDFSKDHEKGKIQTSEELDSHKSIMVVADTHFGLKKEKQNCDPEAFSDFLHWVEELEKNGETEVKLGMWGTTGEKMTVKAPEKMVFLGDILELWDTTKESVDACSRSIIQTLAKLICEKIYVLGNHDHELESIQGNYPLGQSRANISSKEYAATTGNKKLIFVHGHQFDKLFALPTWRIMSLFNKVATVFGKYIWVFAALFGLNVLLLVFPESSGVTDWGTLLFLGSLVVPFFIVRFGRDIWNTFRTTKYNPEDAEEGLKRWWSDISKKDEPEEVNIIFGHTHSIGFRSMNIGNDKLTLFNLPAWIKDQNEKYGVSLENVFRHGFLYIDNNSMEFMGWDTEGKKPFFIPKSLIQERQQNDLDQSKTDEVYEQLVLIGWPEELIDKWFKYSFPGKILT
jgi:UDP-2,3-diacylglucosamine pyrophosphatase LpxH